MDLKQHLLDLEVGFWKGDEAFYDAHLTEDALMVFPEPMGMMDRGEILESIAAGRRWAHVVVEAPCLLHLSEGAVVLVYTAEGMREGAETPYRTPASSVYVRRGHAWQLAFHQQSPTPGEG